MADHVSQPYVMEDPREAERLAMKVDAHRWVSTTLQPYLESAHTVLDVGCGPAVIARAIGEMHPEIDVTGLDGSKERLKVAAVNVAGMSNVSVRHGIATALSFAADSFDLVYTRFLLQYLPEPARAVAEMVRVCKPGGRVLLQDLDGQLLWHYPVNQPLQEGIERVLQSMAAGGFDPFVGRKLFSLARAAGLTEITAQVGSYHLIPGSADPRTFAEWELKLDIALPVITQALGSREAAVALKQEFLVYLLREDTLTYSTVFTVSGVKPPSGP